MTEQYQKHGFQANQDIPGNLYWEDLFNASPNSKVILTVRDSEQAWKNSWTKFVNQEFGRVGNPAFWIFRKLITWGMLGPKMRNMDEFAGRMIANVLPGYDYRRSDWTWQSYVA